MEKEFGICDIELYNNCIKYMFLRFYSCGATSQTQCLQGTESSFVFDDCAQVAEHPVNVRLATAEAERRPNTSPLGVDFYLVFIQNDFSPILQKLFLRQLLLLR